MPQKEAFMSLIKMLNIWPEYPLANVLFWFLVITILPYFARSTAHQALISLSRVMHSSLRLMARSILLAEKRLVRRNKEVLFTAGIESSERSIEREFQRVDAVVKRDLGSFPLVQRNLADHLATLEEDYKNSSELPVPPPVWIKAVEAVARIPSDKDSSVAEILGEIHKTTENQYKHTMEEYRKLSGDRNSVLNKMMPAWRKVAEILDQVGKKFSSLQERARVIDRRLDEYDEIRFQTDKAARMLTSSSTTQFFISGFVLLIAIGGAIINFNLIALPMSEMVGGGSYIGAFKTSNVAALVIIFVEMAMGLYLMESLRITSLFPIIGQMDDKMRVRMIWITFAILFILSLIESSLAFMRDHIAADMHSLRQSLAGIETSASPNSWIPTAGQMVMGFILPFALTFVAIPLESFVHSFRTVAGIATATMMRWLAFMLRLLGNIFRYLGKFTVHLYDLIIFPALWVETMILNRRQENGNTKMTPEQMEMVAEKEAQ